MPGNPSNRFELDETRYGDTVEAVTPHLPASELKRSYGKTTADFAFSIEYRGCGFPLNTLFRNRMFAALSSAVTVPTGWRA